MGFEPTVTGYATTVFKTVSFGRSDIPPVRATSLAAPIETRHDRRAVSRRSVALPTGSDQNGAMTEKQYVGDGITVLWHSDRCIHSAHCATTLPRVFRPQERPWIDVTGADAGDIRATIDGCPSGALGYIVDDGPNEQQAEPLTEAEPAIEAVTVSVTANGPLEVSGMVKVLAADGDVIEESERVFLCRCGHSAKKPFCDGSHKRMGFQDSGVPSPAGE